MESLCKHIIPAFSVKNIKEELNILDICFGLGFNTLSTLYYAKESNYKGRINIYSPELDSTLVSSLLDFKYPKEFDSYKEIIASICKENFYRDENIFIEIFLGDARKYIKTLKPKSFDIVYQDAFSPKANPALWTYEYFKEIKTVLKDDGILTTYSTALATRLALYENGFNIYLNEGDSFRASTVASLSKLDIFSIIDMKHKIECNPHIRALRDTQKSDN
ncbi:MAG: hypothetical protein QG559_845 [Campylobacterota bacterium]|nr:hypothetical protein [Campylobacterota bacterium]